MLGFSAARRAPGHFGSRRHTHTQSARRFLYGNRSCQLPDRQVLQYDWLMFSDVGVSQGWLESHWWSGSNEYVSHRHVREKDGGGGSDRKRMTGAICESIWVIACDLSMRLCMRLCAWGRKRVGLEVKPPLTLFFFHLNHLLRRLTQTSTKDGKSQQTVS